MMAQPVPHQPSDRKRVKVYELRNNDWFDRGTGFCSAAYVPSDDPGGKEPRVIVESEDEPERLLLRTRISREDGFQRQQDTLIVWTDPATGLDMALSFQEAEGCLLIWTFISAIQQAMGVVMADDNLSDDMALEMSPTITLPPAELKSLAELENSMRMLSASAAGRDALARCIMSEEYIRKLIPLVSMAEDLESLSDLHHLCNIVKIILLLNDTSIIEHAVSDECVLGVVGALEYDPDFPSHKANHRQWLNQQGRYKEVIRIQDDEIRKKIHQTYRLQYLKDVVLARILDDPTFSVLTSLIFFNQVDIVQHLQNDAGFLGDLFGIFADPSEAMLRKKQAVLFIQQCCAIAKNLQPPARITLYNNFLSHGLLNVVNFGLRNRDVAVRVGATDILVSMIDHDPQMVRQTVYRQMNDQQPQLTDTLIDLLLVEADLGIKSQVVDAIKVLLDPVSPTQLSMVDQNAVAGANTGSKNGDNNMSNNLQRRPQTAAADPQQVLFLTNFYERSAPRLFKPLIDLEHQTDLRFSVTNDGIYSCLNDILCFFIRQHQQQCKFFMLQHNLALRFVQLLGCRINHLQLVAVRFFRQLAATRDEFYARHIMEKRLIAPIFDLLERILPRDNLLCSACLEFFDFFAKEDLGELNRHLVETYRERIQALSYMPTFRDLLSGKQPQNALPNALSLHHAAAAAAAAVTAATAATTTASTSSASTTGSGVSRAGIDDDDEDDDIINNMSVSGAQAREGSSMATSGGGGGTGPVNGFHRGLLAMDPDEDAYWNGSDEDDDDVPAMSATAASTPSASPLLATTTGRIVSGLNNANGNGGSSPMLKQLVDYASDEEEEDGDGEAKEEEDALDGPDSGGRRSRNGTRPTTGLDGTAILDEEDDAHDSSGQEENDENLAVAAGNGKARSASPSLPSSPSSSPLSSLLNRPPLERISEKRRREEDEEDELEKLLVQNKRRNSQSSSRNMANAVNRRTSAGNNIGGPLSVSDTRPETGGGGTATATATSGSIPKTSGTLGTATGARSGTSAGTGRGISTTTGGSPGPGTTTSAKKISINLTSAPLKTATAGGRTRGPGDDAV